MSVRVGLVPEKLVEGGGSLSIFRGFVFWRSFVMIFFCIVLILFGNKEWRVFENNT